MTELCLDRWCTVNFVNVPFQQMITGSLDFNPSTLSILKINRTYSIYEMGKETYSSNKLYSITVM